MISSSLALLLTSATSFAQSTAALTQTPFVAITTDATPGEVYHLGYTIDRGGEIAGVYYENNFGLTPEEKLKTFTIAQMKKGSVLLQKEANGKTYDFLKGTAVLQADNTYRFTLDYLKNAIFGTRASVVMGVRFNAAKNQFEAFNVTNQKAILTAQIKVKTLAGQPVGVDAVNYQYSTKAARFRR